MKRLLKLLSVFLLLSPIFVSAAELAVTPADLAVTELTVEPLPISFDGIPAGATHVKLLPLILHASCEGDVELRYLKLTRRGMGDSTYVTGVYVLDGDTRVTRSGRFSSSGQTVLLGFKNYIVPACKTARLAVAVDLARGTAIGSQFAIAIESAADIVSTADKLSAPFPLRSTSAQSVTPAPVGQLIVEFRPIGRVRTVRDDVLAKFSVEARDSHHLISGITLTNDGSARESDLRNLYLTQMNGRALTSVVTSLTDDAVTLKFMQQYFVRSGQKVSFELHGQAFTSVKTINFTLEEASDLVAVPTRRAGRTLGNEARNRSMRGGK